MREKLFHRDSIPPPVLSCQQGQTQQPQTGGQVLGQEPISLSHTLLLFIHLVGMYLCEKEAALSGSFFCCLQPFLGQAAKSLPLIQQLLIQQVQAHTPQHLVV